MGWRLWKWGGWILCLVGMGGEVFLILVLVCLVIWWDGCWVYLYCFLDVFVGIG